MKAAVTRSLRAEVASSGVPHDPVGRLPGDALTRLTHTSQPHVWSWVYPCGNCAGYEFVHDRLHEAGDLVARTYPDEARGGHLVPNLQTWAPDPFEPCGYRHLRD